jgi:hypothetical protein
MISERPYWQVRYRAFDRHAGAAAYNGSFTSAPAVRYAAISPTG